MERAGPDGRLGQARCGRHKLECRVQARGTRALNETTALGADRLRRSGQALAAGLGTPSPLSMCVN